MQKIVVIVDMQNDFILGPLGSGEAQAALLKISKMIEEESENTYFIFTQDTHGKNYLSTPEGKKLPVEHCIKGTDGWKIHPSLTKHFYDSPLTVEKPTFGSIELMEMLDDMIEVTDETEVLFCGVCTDICVVSNALMAKAWFPEIKITVDSKLCAGTTPEAHEAALTTMKSCQIDVI